MSTNTKKGFYTLEGAIFLPIFIIAVLTIAYFIKVIGAGEDVMHATTDDGRNIASHAYIIKTGIGMGSSLENRILNENEDIGEVNVYGMKYLFEKDEIDGLISFNIKYNVSIKLPLKLYHDVEENEKVLFRGWIGKVEDWPPMSFDDMEKNEGSETVWIFPRSGTKYHNESCTYVSNYPQELVLNESLKKYYTPCKICNASELTDGSLIYCFTKYGEAYHKGSCEAVDKYTISLEKKVAEERGYTPCSKCGGT